MLKNIQKLSKPSVQNIMSKLRFKQIAPGLLQFFLKALE